MRDNSTSRMNISTKSKKKDKVQRLLTSMKYNPRQLSRTLTFLAIYSLSHELDDMKHNIAELVVEAERFGRNITPKVRVLEFNSS